MTTFYIYEIPGVKNGATKMWKRRTSKNIQKYGIQPILIETIEGPDNIDTWKLVGDREWELADQNGYPRGEHYLSIRVKSDHPNKSIAGKTARTTTMEIAEEIRSKYIPYKYSYGKLAKEYGLSVHTVTNIVLNRSYIEA